MEKEIKGMLGLILDKMESFEMKVDRLESRMDSFELKLDRLESRVDSFETKMELRMDNLESRQDEIYLVVKAIEHNNQVHRAEIDNLKYSVSNVEGTINAMGDVITKRKAI